MQQHLKTLTNWLFTLLLGTCILFAYGCNTSKLPQAKALLNSTNEPSSAIGEAAGGHFNPDKVNHGYLPQDGFTKAHGGDLGNITIGPDGTGNLSLTVPGLTLEEGPHHVTGLSVIVHAQPDDFSQPVGNAGSRIGCGLISLVD